MARCTRCDKKGLMLKLDHSGLCVDCAAQVAKASELERRAMQDRIDALQAFQDEYSAIPDARAEAERILTDAHTGAERVIGNAGTEADSMIAEARAKAEEIGREAESVAEQCVQEAQEKAERAIAAAQTREEAVERKSKDMQAAAIQAIAEAKKTIDGFLSVTTRDFNALTDKFFERLPK